MEQTRKDTSKDALGIAAYRGQADAPLLRRHDWTDEGGRPSGSFINIFYTNRCSIIHFWRMLGAMRRKHTSYLPEDLSRCQTD